MIKDVTVNINIYEYGDELLFDKIGMVMVMAYGIETHGRGGSGGGGEGSYSILNLSGSTRPPPLGASSNPPFLHSTCGLVVVIDRFGQVRLLAGQVGGKSEEAEVVERHQLLRGEREVGPEATPLNLVLISLEAQLLMLLPKLLQRGGWVGLGMGV